MLRKLTVLAYGSDANMPPAYSPLSGSNPLGVFSKLVPEVGFEPTHPRIEVFETSASAVPPLGPVLVRIEV